MARTNLIKRMMQGPLPGRTYQRRLQYRPELDEIDYYYDLLNRHIFAGELNAPIIYVGRTTKVWGECYWVDDIQETGSYCFMRISDKWFCQQWFLNVLAHEMVHQYQWDVGRWSRPDPRYSKMIRGAHGPSFFEWREDFHRLGLYLKTAYSIGKWFKYQTFHKC